MRATVIASATTAARAAVVAAATARTRFGVGSAGRSLTIGGLSVPVAGVAAAVSIRAAPVDVSRRHIPILIRLGAASAISGSLRSRRRSGRRLPAFEPLTRVVAVVVRAARRGLLLRKSGAGFTEPSLVPAPIKPMPAMIWAAMRVWSPPYLSAICADKTVNIAEPKQISILVRKPDALCRNSLSKPINPPSNVASTRRPATPPSICIRMNSTLCSKPCTINSSQKFITG